MRRHRERNAWMMANNETPLTPLNPMHHRDMATPKPNIVFMLSDDHGREALGCYGNKTIETPHLDALAKAGVRFTNAFCTTASCAASRSTILTGRHNHATGTYGHTHGIHHFSCFDHVMTLPAMLRDGGYRTGRVGKKHYAPDSLFPFDWGLPENRFGRDDVAMSEACREFVDGPSPFFLYWCSKNPHRESARDSHPLRPDNFGNPESSFTGDREQVYDEHKVEIPSFLNDMPEVRAEIAQYYQSISRLDRGIGKLLSVLKETNQLANTVLIYISDNGAAFPQAKTTLYEPGMALPCIVCDPANERRGTPCDGLITWADITPTVLDIAGIEIPDAGFHGRSFAAIMNQTSPENWRDEIFASHTFHEITNYYPMRVVRTHRYKFIWNVAWKLDYSFAADLWESASWQACLRNGVRTLGMRNIDDYIHRPRFELYDLKSDPHELENLVDHPDCRDLVLSFADKIRSFQQRTQDPWRHKWIYE